MPPERREVTRRLPNYGLHDRNYTRPEEANRNIQQSIVLDILRVIIQNSGPLPIPASLIRELRAIVQGALTTGGTIQVERNHEATMQARAAEEAPLPDLDELSARAARWNGREPEQIREALRGGPPTFEEPTQAAPDEEGPTIRRGRVHEP